MKAKTFSLKINKPCTESWDEMTLNGIGKHCASCNKVVIDFSRLSESEIADQIKNAVGKICGRFRKEQLQVVYAVNSRRRAPWYNQFFVKMALTGILTLKLADAGAQTTSTPIEKTTKDNSGKKKNKIKETTSDKKKTISGKVIDKDSREAIQYATITIANTKISTVTDAEGKFTIEVPSDFKGKNVTIQISGASYTSATKSFAVSTLPRKEFLALLSYQEQMLMGDIDIEYEKTH
ncbi:MAG: carboxypeptidase-like regulatory domain-containing protein [Bacteroidia bacterium]|nr:carboxypeptidase-like regulatory domain-containing protein [Bacteroidia bacterium]